jgi:hydroxylamine dehydrogenase
MEIYTESKHGIQFRANIAKMNLDAKSWVVGKDYSAAPTCATCHMSATSNQPVTHDVGDRISFTLRPVVSFKLENWEKRRAAMQGRMLELPRDRLGRELL